ncbi:unnamed protein product [Camellia sinensis]
MKPSRTLPCTRDTRASFQGFCCRQTCEDLETILRRFPIWRSEQTNRLSANLPSFSKKPPIVFIPIPNRSLVNLPPFRSIFRFGHLLSLFNVPSHRKRLRRRETSSFSKKKKIDKVECVIEPTTGESENQPKVERESNIDNREPKQQQLKQATELHKARGKKKVDGRKTRTKQIHDHEAKYVYRSNIQSLINFFKTTKLKEKHLALLRKTHFSLLVDRLSKNKMKRRDSMKYDNVVAKILQTYQMDGETFKIGAKKLKLKSNDFKLIFGIVCGQKKMNLSYRRKNEIDMVKGRSITESIMTRTSITKSITQLLESNNNEDIENVVRLVCLLICLLLLYQGTRTTIGWGFMRYIEDIDIIKFYDWCGAAKQQLTRSIESNMNQIDKVSGCVIVLLHEIEEIPVHVQRSEHSFEQLENDEEKTMIKQKVGLTTSLGFKHQTPVEKRKAKRKLVYETNLYHVKINEHTFEKLEENMFIIRRLKMEKARIQAENDDLKDPPMTLNKQMDEDKNKAKTQIEVKDVEIVLLNERIAMLVESNVYLDSQEQQIVVEVEATTPKKSSPVSLMIKRVKNRETRRKQKDPDFWYITKKQPNQNKTGDEVQPMVEERAKTTKEDETHQQHPTKDMDTSYPVFHRLPKRSRMKLTRLWATKTNSDPILQGKHIGGYLYLDDIDKIVK